MKTRVHVTAVLLFVTVVAWSSVYAAPKGGNGGKGGDTNIVSETLGWPAETLGWPACTSSKDFGLGAS
jgi:hypothetical protein